MKRLCYEAVEIIASTYPFYSHRVSIPAAVRHHAVVEILKCKPLPLVVFGLTVVADVTARANEATRSAHVRSSKC